MLRKIYDEFKANSKSLKFNGNTKTCGLKCTLRKQ